MNKIQKGNTVNIHFIGTLEDGTEFGNSYVNNKPLSAEVGSGQLIAGFDTALEGMAIGEVKTFALTSEQAYGDVNPEAFQTVPHDAFPSEFNFKVGGTVRGTNPDGQSFVAQIESVGENDVTLNFNHPLAGKNLNFKIEVLSID